MIKFKAFLELLQLVSKFTKQLNKICQNCANFSYKSQEFLVTHENTYRVLTIYVFYQLY